MKIHVVGLGKLGLPVALALEQAGHDVTGWDVSHDRLMRIIETIGGKRLSVPEVAHEPHLGEFLTRSKMRLIPLEEAGRVELVLICVQTPHEPQFEGLTPLEEAPRDFDYTWLRDAVGETVETVMGDGYRTQHPLADPLVVTVSTCLPGTYRKVIRPLVRGKVRYAYMPLFIAMGSVIEDFYNPEFVLCGTEDPAPPSEVRLLYQSIIARGARQRGVIDPPLRDMSVTSAELTKVAYNAFIGFKLMLANGVAMTCDAVGADADDVMGALKCANRRLISTAYLSPGMGDGGACFPPGEMVMTEQGPKPIETVKVGDNVLTLDGSLQPVLKTWEREYEGELVHVVPQGLPGAWMTADHPVMVRLDERVRQANGRKRTEMFPMGPVMELDAGVLSTDHLATWPTPRVAPPAKPVHANAAYVELAGWYLSEGSAELSGRRGRLRFDLHAKERGQAHRIGQLLLRSAPPRPSGRGNNACLTHKVEGNRRSVRFGTMALTARLVGDFGKGAASKRLPGWALWGSTETACLLLKGLLDGDAWLGDRGVSYSTVSDALAWGVFILISRLGFHPNLRVIEARPGHQLSYEVRVRNRAQADALLAMVGLPSSVVPGAHEVSVGEWRPIRRLDQKRYKGPVHNLWVAGSNTYVTASGAVHNCHPRDQIALSWLAGELGLEHDPYRAVIDHREAHARWLGDMLWRASMDYGIPPVILGRAYKKNSTLQAGSHALLVQHYVTTRYGYPVICQDEAMDPYPVAAYLIAMPHDHFLGADLPGGSVLIDPWGGFPTPRGVEVIRPGRRSDGRIKVA